MDRAAYGDVSLIRRSRRQLLRIRSEERGRHPKETHSTHSRRTTLYLPCTGRLFEGGGAFILARGYQIIATKKGSDIKKDLLISSFPCLLVPRGCTHGNTGRP